MRRRSINYAAEKLQQRVHAALVHSPRAECDLDGVSYPSLAHDADNARQIRLFEGWSSGSLAGGGGAAGTDSGGGGGGGAASIGSGAGRQPRNPLPEPGSLGLLRMVGEECRLPHGSERALLDKMEQALPLHRNRYTVTVAVTP